jgi:hypothetical protein
MTSFGVDAAIDTWNWDSSIGEDMSTNCLGEKGDWEELCPSPMTGAGSGSDIARVVSVGQAVIPATIVTTTTDVLTTGSHSTNGTEAE